jgi:DNA-binding transcriptional ArsR family regulator
MNGKAKKVAELLKILANENRLMILCALIESPHSVSKLAEKVPNITQSALSQHLAVLKSNGILDNTKSGLNIIYSIADHRVEAVINVLKEYYCNENNKY